MNPWSQYAAWAPAWRLFGVMVTNTADKRKRREAVFRVDLPGWSTHRKWSTTRTGGSVGRATTLWWKPCEDSASPKKNSKPTILWTHMESALYHWRHLSKQQKKTEEKNQHKKRHVRKSQHGPVERAPAFHGLANAPWGQVHGLCLWSGGSVHLCQK